MDKKLKESHFEDEINLADYFRVLWKRKYLIVLGSVLPALVVGLVIFSGPKSYKVTQNPGGRTFGSDTMPYTGVLILIFVILHLYKFTFADKSVVPIYQQMAAAFSNPLWVIFYVAAMGVVAVHLSHGIWSLFQTLGLNHPRYMPLIMKLGLVVTFVFGIGFGVLPIFIMIMA